MMTTTFMRGNSIWGNDGNLQIGDSKRGC